MNTDKLEIILEKVKTLKEEQFRFEEWITEFDEEKSCGTVCCIVGWMPQWFPNCGIKYMYEYGYLELCVEDEIDSYERIMSHLSTLLGIPLNVVEYLFAGKQKPSEDLPKLNLNSSLSAVIEAWEKTIKWLKIQDSLFKYSLT